MPWARSLAVWAVLMAVESIHGTLRVLYLEPRIGDAPARRLAVLTGLVLIFLVTLASIRWLRATNRATLLAIGCLWAGLTVVFEFAIGRLVFGLGWERILGDYDLPRGGLMGLGLLGLLAMPWVCSRIRRPDAIDRGSVPP